MSGKGNEIEQQVAVLEQRVGELECKVGARKCACGCGLAVKGRSDKRYASKACKMRAKRARAGRSHE